MWGDGIPQRIGTKQSSCAIFLWLKCYIWGNSLYKRKIILVVNFLECWERSKSHMSDNNWKTSHGDHICFYHYSLCHMFYIRIFFLIFISLSFIVVASNIVMFQGKYTGVKNKRFEEMRLFQFINVEKENFFLWFLFSVYSRLYSGMRIYSWYWHNDPNRQFAVVQCML